MEHQKERKKKMGMTIVTIILALLCISFLWLTVSGKERRKFHCTLTILLFIALVVVYSIQ